MSANAAIFNPTESTSAATGDGFSCPRLSTTGRLAISFGPNDKGMMVYDTTLNSLFIWNGSAWELIDGTGTSSNTQVLFNDNGAPAGDPTMVFDKATDTLTVQNLVVTGSTTALGGLDASAIRAAASDYAAVNFDGATASTRIASTITTNPITTGDYTVWSRFRVPTTSIAGQDPLWTLGSSADGGGAYGITARYFTATNLINIIIRNSAGGSSGGDSATADVTVPFATYAGQVVDLVVVRVGSVLTVYLNGTSLAVTYSGTQATFALAPGNFPTNPAQFFGVGASTTVPFRGRIYRSVVFNRALSATDVTELITVGVNPADQWGTQTAAYTKTTFPAAGADSWTALNSDITATVNSTAPDATTEWMSVERTTSTGRCDINRNSTLPTGQVNKRFRGSALIYNEDCGTRWFGVQVDNPTTVFDSSAQLANGAQGTITQEFIAGNSTAIRIGPLATANGLTSVGSVALNANYFVKAIVLTRIGAIVDLDFTVGTGYQATDRSTNQLNGTLFNGVSWTMPETSARLYATTAFLGNSQLLGTLSIPTNAVIEDIFVFVVGTSTIQIGDVSGGSSIVGSQIAAGYTRLTLAGFRSTTGNLWVNSSNSNSMTFTIIYSISQP